MHVVKLKENKPKAIQYFVKQALRKSLRISGKNFACIAK